MTPGDWIVLAAFAGWALASALGQVRVEKLQRFRRWDVLGLIPHWSMFPTIPDWCDYHVLCRDYVGRGVTSRWTTVLPIPERRWFHVFWNPGKYILKVMNYVVRGLTLARRNGDPARLHTSLPYLIVLEEVACVPRIDAEATQFMILRDDPSSDDPPTIVLLSAFHQL